MSERISAVSTQDGTIVVHVPMQFKRKAGRRQVVVTRQLPEMPSQTADSPDPRPVSEIAQDPVVIALARAFRWKELLESGRFRSITALAKTFRVDGSYVGRILRMTLLAPDIVEMIVNGTAPEELSLKKLTETFPMEWKEQRKMFYFL